MSQSLTSKYRPQTFADVAGQETIKRILSRASAEDRIAPAYLFSGTRGVGKTTIARILAKAVNCEKGPAAEPCNECEHCRQITQGAAVDVVEIDGASNRGIDDARRLKEDIGYAPMQCRYKVFIIDEAHMLTREAFNALLKTLEEPPGNATFILATTEPHKFPATIVSRCQHYAFKRLTSWEIEDHLANILTSEQVQFDPSALKLISRRAAGSVRDSMSLLGQVLALGSEKLVVEDVRSVLGLAGQELFFRVMEGIEARDCVALSHVLGEVLDQGLDLGFFLRELTSMWRNLFLLKQSGEAALELLELPDEEAAKWLEWVPRFSVAHIHACWQLTLEGQRRVLTALEPALALELLLLNLAFLPDLLSLETLSAGQAEGGRGAQGMGGGAPSGQPPQGGWRPPQGSAPAQGRNFAPQSQQPQPQAGQRAPAPPQAGNRPQQLGGPRPWERQGPQPGAGTPQAQPPQSQPRPQQPPQRQPGQQAAQPRESASGPAGAQPPAPPEPKDPPGPSGRSTPAGTRAASASPAIDSEIPPWVSEGPDVVEEPTPSDDAVLDSEYGGGADIAPQPRPGKAFGRTSGEASGRTPGGAPVASGTDHAQPGPRTWQGFLAHVERASREDGKPAPMLNGVEAHVEGGAVEVICANGFQKELLENGDKMARLTGMAHEYFGDNVDFSVRTASNAPEKTYKDIKAELEEEEIVQQLQKELGAHLLNWEPLRKPLKRGE